MAALDHPGLEATGGWVARIGGDARLEIEQALQGFDLGDLEVVAGDDPDLGASIHGGDQFGLQVFEARAPAIAPLTPKDGDPGALGAARAPTTNSKAAIPAGQDLADSGPLFARTQLRPIEKGSSPKMTGNVELYGTQTKATMTARPPPRCTTPTPRTAKASARPRSGTTR